MVRPSTLRRRLAFRLRWAALGRLPLGGAGGRRLPLARPLLGPLGPLGRGRPLRTPGPLRLGAGLVATAADRPLAPRFPPLGLPQPLTPLARLLLGAHPQPAPPPLPPT